MCAEDLEMIHLIDDLLMQQCGHASSSKDSYEPACARGLSAEEECDVQLPSPKKFTRHATNKRNDALERMMKHRSRAATGLEISIAECASWECDAEQRLASAQNAAGAIVSYYFSNTSA
mmetsp:Transcript_18175/g.50163  ORF Transcript_18175/g.50163 Transcript_18175/m.50163 type:complete len:119 (+) Transcript_18175:76-432(+)